MQELLKMKNEILKKYLKCLNILIIMELLVG